MYCKGTSAKTQRKSAANTLIHSKSYQAEIDHTVLVVPANQMHQAAFHKVNPVGNEDRARPSASPSCHSESSATKHSWGPVDLHKSLHKKPHRRLFSAD